MRLKISVDVRSPLKRKKKIVGKDKTEFVVQCKYQKLGDICFIGGLVTHTKRFCKKKFDVGSSKFTREWGSWLKASLRRGAAQGRSKWLRDESSGDWGENFGNEDKVEVQIPNFSNLIIQVVKGGNSC